MLHATFVNIDESNNEVTSIALDAINRIMPTVGLCFEVKEQRDYIMEGLLKAATFSDDDIKEMAIQALTQTVEMGYKCMGDYVVQIGETSIQLL